VVNRLHDCLRILLGFVEEPVSRNCLHDCYGVATASEPQPIDFGSASMICAGPPDGQNGPRLLDGALPPVEYRLD
jgi:hypothetical protein